MRRFYSRDRFGLASLVLLAAGVNAAGGCIYGTVCEPEDSRVEKSGAAKPMAVVGEEELEYDPVASAALNDHLEESYQKSKRKARLLNQQKMGLRSAIESTSLAEADALWRGNLNFADVSARDALAELVEPLGLTLAAEGEAAKRLEQVVSVNRENCSPLEAIEEVCRAVGAYPDYGNVDERANDDGGGLAAAMAFMLCPPVTGEKSAGESESTAPETPVHVVHIRAGERPLPVIFAGPLCIEVGDMQEQAPHATGNLEVRVHAAGLPPSVMAYGEMTEALEIQGETIASASGQALDWTRGFQQPWFDLPNFHSRGHWFSFTKLLRAVDGIHLKGAVRVDVPVSVRSVRFEKLQADDSKTCGDCSFNFDGGKKEGSEDGEDRYELRFTIKCPLDAIRLDRDQFLFFDAEGNGLENEDYAFHLVNDRVRESGESIEPIAHPLTNQNDKTLDEPAVAKRPETWQEWWAILTVVGKPASLTIQTIDRVETLEYPFEFTIPLRMAQSQPLEMEKLRFKGETPIAIETRKIVRDGDFSHVEVRFSNRTNLDIEGAWCLLEYFDADGRLLSHERGHLFGIFAGEAKDQDVTAFDLPSNAERVVVTATSVNFKNGLRWPAEQL